MRQAQALSVLLSGANVFLTGPPGAGKTYVLNEFVQRARKRGKTVAVTASTGIAATHLSGTTIHSWSGLGIRDSLSQHDLEWLGANDRLRKRYNATDILVIDEVSMLHGARLDMVNMACKLLRQNDKPFGGLQVVLVGDLFQLPPVSRGHEVFDFAHLSQAWEELSPQICYLSEQHRQAEDGLLDLLTALRSGDFEEEHLALLNSRKGQDPGGITITRLYTHNRDVDSINDRHLKALVTDSKTYNMATKGAQAKVEQLIKSVLAPDKLQLKVGAEVMFVANNFAEGFVNGSRGQVIDFNGTWPVVRLLDNDRVLKVEPHTWSLTEDGRVRAEVSQLPLRLAWAITIHKSQGMSLDAAEIDLSQAFTPGMGYVALSRVRSLDGVFLLGLNPTALQLHPDIYEFDRGLKQDSAGLAARTEDVADEDQEVDDPGEASYDAALFQALREWRYAQAKTQAIAPYMVAHDATLMELARRMPQTSAQLSAVKGFGPMKIEKYGPELITLVTAHAKTLTH
ncbi:MAG: ATPase [Candidatus Saccharibacteria bacterium]|nr:ATPase [Candidatus Saccharibacteria bacterium]